MPKDRHARRHEAPRLDFLDRDQEIQTLRDHLVEGYRNSSSLRVIELFGVGGVGKTTLIGETLKKIPIEIEDNICVRISLEGERTHGVLAPLSSISDSVPLDCYRFLAARLAIYLKEGRRPPAGPASFRTKSFDILLDVLGFPKLIEYGVGMLEKIRRALEHWRLGVAKDVGHFFEPEARICDIEDKIGYLLGLDIREHLESKQESCFFFYECYEHQATTTKSEGSLWLQDFISGVGRGVHVIATREYIGWDESWDEHLVPLPLTHLPDSVCIAALLDALPGLTDPDMTLILDAIGGLPFYLEVACAPGDPARAMAVVRAGGTRSDQRSTLVRRFLEGMDKNTAAMIKDLGLVQYFDHAIFESIRRRLGIPIPSVDFGSLVRISVVERVLGQGQKDLYKTHDLFSRHLRQDADQETALRVVSATMESLEVTGMARQAAAFVYLGVLAALDPVGRLPAILTDQMIEAGYRLYIMGAWRTLAQAPSVLSEPGRERPGGVLARLFEALSRRKLDRIAPALDTMMALRDEAPASPELQGAVRIEAAYLMEIGGDYSGARMELAHAFEGLGPFRPRQQRHVRTVLYYADILAMFGQLEDSEGLLVEHGTLLADADNWADWAEYQRHRGHCYRFSFLFQEAAEIYSRAHERAQGYEALEAKLVTNLAETLCWCAPEQGLDLAQQALTLNRRLDTPIEAGKALASRAVALAALGSFVEAWSDCEEADRLAQKADYVAGRVFATLAACRVAAGQRSPDILASAATRLEELVERLGVYEIARVPAYVLSGRSQEARCVARKVRPLDPFDFVDRVERLLTGDAP